MLLAEVLETRHVVFVGGKGGVGKTTVASALAASAAARGRSVLLVSTDPAHNLGHLWQRPLGDRATALAPGLRGIELDPGRAVDAHVAQVEDTMRRLLPEHTHGEIRRHLTLAREAPGTHEAATLDRIAEIVATADDDLVVFDTAPTGHTLRLLELPPHLAAWTDRLLRRRRHRDQLGHALTNVDGNPPDPDDGLRDILTHRHQRLSTLHSCLTDPHRCAFVVVTLAERLPIAETLDLLHRLNHAGIWVPSVVVNRMAGPADAAERRASEATQWQALQAGAPSADLVPAGALPVGPLGAEQIRAWGAALLSPPDSSS